MKGKKILFTILAAILSYNTTMAADYTLRAGDELSIVVMQQAEADTTSKEYIIRPDGKVSIPFVGEIDATGMTVSQFTNTVEKGLSRYIVNPDVTVNIVKLGSVRVYVFGEINKPGVYELTKSHRVIDAIGAAGSFNWDTAKKKIFLIHQDNPEKAIPINLNKMLQTGDMTENYELREGDVLYLTKNSRISFSRDIAPLLTGAYTISRISNDD